jgi:hypothetical protein
MSTLTLVAGLCTMGQMDNGGGRVIHDPTHRLADVAGWVATIGGAVDPFVAGGDLPPDMPGWPVVYPVARPEEGAVLVEADGDGEPEILFSTGKIVRLMNVDGSNVPGWPKTIPSGNHLAGGPAFADLDGDGTGEVIVCAENWPNGNIGWVYAYHTDGSLVDGFPALTAGDHSRSPTATDLDGDGDAEIIVGERAWPLGRVFVFDGDGSTMAGWPRDINHVPASSAGAADLDGDGLKEIVYQSYESIYAFHMDGTVMDGWPYTPATGDVFSYSAPVFADVDGDGLSEIVIGGHSLAGTSHVFLLDGDGTDLPGWPRPASWWVYAPPTIVDVDGDDELEILVGDQVLSPSPTNKVYGWNIDGTNATGFPIGPIDAINAQVAVGDIDGDGDPELIWDDNVTVNGSEGKLRGFHHDGSEIEGWPLITNGTPFFNTVCLDDMDGDGDLELLAPCGQVQTAETTMYLWDLPDTGGVDSVEMPMFQYGPGRDGIVPESGCAADFNGDGAANILDFVAFQIAFVGMDPEADCDGNGMLNILDFVCFQGVFQAGCP